MSGSQGQPAAAGPGRGFRGAEGLIAIAAGALVALLVWFVRDYYPRRAGPPQPIPFSHRVHAGDKQIGCFVCHSEAISTPRAGVPPLQTCMLCHQRIITTHPEIRILRAHYESDEPVPWVQVYQLPEFVYFNHEAHIRRQVDCGVCHGNVREMDRVIPEHEFLMGFCVQCHRDNNVSHDCFVCHR